MKWDLTTINTFSIKKEDAISLGNYLLSISHIDDNINKINIIKMLNYLKTKEKK